MYVCVWVYECISLSIYVCTCIHMYVCMCIHTYIPAHMQHKHLHTHTLPKSTGVPSGMWARGPVTARALSAAHPQCRYICAYIHTHMHTCNIHTCTHTYSPKPAGVPSDMWAPGPVTAGALSVAHPVGIWRLQDLVLLRGFMCTNQSSFYCTPHQHCAHNCTTFARLLRNIRPPSDPPWCMSYTIQYW